MIIGFTKLATGYSLLVITDTVIDCGNRAYQFMVKFPDISQCAEAHERSYQKYVSKLNLQNTLYMVISRDQGLSIKHKHRSKTLLNKEAFKKVHKAVHINTDELCAIKMLSDREEQDTLRKVNILS